MGTVKPGFAEFVELRYADLLRTAYLLTGSSNDAEDLVQSSLLKAMKAWTRIDEPLAYVRRTMANLHVSRWRRHRAREILTAILPERRAADRTEAVADRQALFAALRRLSPRTRTVIVLRYWVDLSEAETARILDCSVGSVKSTASRGLVKLRAILDAAPAPPLTVQTTQGTPASIRGMR